MCPFERLRIFSGAWPFGVIEGIWTAIALRRWWFSHGVDEAGHTVERERISQPNQLTGRVVEVDHGAASSAVVIQLDGGQRVVAALTGDSAEGLAPAPGDSVIAVINSTAVLVAKD